MARNMDRHQVITTTKEAMAVLSSKQKAFLKILLGALFFFRGFRLHKLKSSVQRRLMVISKEFVVKKTHDQFILIVIW